MYNFSDAEEKEMMAVNKFRSEEDDFDVLPANNKVYQIFLSVLLEYCTDGSYLSGAFKTLNV